MASGKRGYSRGYNQDHRPPGRPPAMHYQHDMMNYGFLQRFHDYKEEGNVAMKSGNYQAAFHSYSSALQQVELISSGITERDIAKVFCNRSIVDLKLHCIDLAFEDGIQSIRMDPLWVKGYWRVSCALKEKNEQIQAVQVLVDGYSKITGDNELVTKADFIREIATLSLKVWPKTQALYYKCRAPLNVWSKVVLQLAKQKETKVLHFVFLGGRTMSEGRGVSGMAMNCDASPVQLKPLIRSMGPSDRNRYGMDLMLALIRHGADWKGLSINNGDTPLHVALNHGMEIADFDFLKYLFQHYAKTREERSQIDSEGSTLLHLAAKQKKKQREKAVIFLLNQNVDPNVKDCNGKTPADYANDDWMLVGMLRTWMQKSKSVSSSSKVKGVGTEATSDGVTKKKQQTFYQSGPQGSGQVPGPTGIPERTRRPYSSQNPTVLPSREDTGRTQRPYSSQNPTVLPSRENTGRTQRPYSSQNPTVLPERPRHPYTSQSPTVLPERARRPYSAASVKPVFSQPRSSQKASHNQQSQQHQPKSKTKVNQNAKQPKKQKDYDQALKAFFQCMENKNASLSELVEKCRQEVINTLELPDLKEVSQEVRCSLDPSYWNQTILELQESNRWRVLFFLLNGGGNDCEYGMGGVAKGCDVSKVSILKCLKSKTENVEKLKVIKSLLENGAKPNGLPDEDISPVKYCLLVNNIKYYTIITALIRKEARPEDLIVVAGDSPLHSGLRMCLKYKDRKMDLLNVLLEKYSKSKNDQYLDPTETNMDDDDSLFHIALNEKDEALSLEAVKLLSKNKVNPYLKNKAGKIPITQIKKTDRRYQFLEEAARHHPKKGKKGPKKQKGPARSGEGTEMSPDVSPFHTLGSLPKTKHEKKGKVQTPGIDKQELKRKIALLIKNVLPVIKPAKSENKKMQKQRETKRHVQQEDDEEVENDDTHDKVGAQKKPESQDLEDLEAADLQEIDSTVFDNLVWEVECTAKVWKFLRDRRVPEKIRKAVVNKIQRLGEGNWSKSLAKSLKCDHIYLYEVKVTSGGRILWQKAIAFSPKRSVVPEERLAENKNEFGGIEGGRIYADVIRVWDVVLDHDNVQHAIDVIVKSVDRGQDCILQKKLRGIKKKFIRQEMKIPNLYQEILSEDVSESQAATKKQDFFPPASSKETEYHIMKFYSFSSNLVNNILHDSNTRVDFPFRVTEKEHAIIHINPKPPCSLLLLGRSGTGKTTCCLYRLWSSFVAYWNNAASDGEPRIPRDFCFRHSKDADEELDDETDDSEMSESAEANLEGIEVGEAAASPDPEDTDEEENEIVYDHLHQIFITKNRVLCSEVRKNFRELAHGCDIASHYLKAEDQQHPHRLQDAPIAAFPYFLNSRQFLLMLDASLPGAPFFERKPDGSLKKEIREWQEGDGQQPFLEMMDMDDDSDDDEEDEEEDEEENEREFDPDAEEKIQRKKVAYDARHEVTYEVFANHFWTKMKKKNLDYHPTLVWMEIRSFIKGSIEALHSENGKLDLEDYQKLGKKRAPNFTGDRKEVYDLYKKYEHMKRQQFYFDEADVVFDIYRRLQDVEEPDWAIHQIYVDETQDFTQAELALLIRCCSDPNAIFLTGDTAQSIMRGVAFRFNDLKSLFHYASTSMKALGKQSSVAVPNKVYQLTHNYRSHAGILELAASVVDLLLFFFPSSFDRLKRDQGLFDGPKPVLLDSCSTSDLALILRGNKRKTSEIEFGAHQVILVANDQAKEQLPEELSLALCLTIFEAKGLEFDDVMIYNFFKDSPAREEWRVVQEHLKDIQNQTIDINSNTSSLFELDIDVMNSAEQPRRLSFDPDKHKVLNSELKYLYTAISRARVNVWIFDEDTDNRRPMFQYFKARKLVSVLEAELDISEQSKSLDVMFVEKSSAEDWEKRGDYFYNNGLWEVSVKCYLRAGNHQKVLKAKANHRVNEAEKMKGTNMAKMREWFLEAAHDFMQCGMHNEAARCLFNTKEFDLSAQLFEQIGDVAGAAKIYETRLQRYVDASRCHEKLGNYAVAVKVLKQNKEYDKAADVIERYKQRKSEDALPENVIAPRDTIDTCCHLAAKHHYQHGALNKMLESLNRLPNVDDRITFLKSRGQHHYAVEILKSEGRLKDAAIILKSTGDLLQAIEICGEDQQEFRAECHLKLAKQKVQQLRNLDMSKPPLPPSIKFSGNIDEKKNSSNNADNKFESNTIHEVFSMDASCNTENKLSEREKNDNTKKVEIDEELSTTSEVNEKQNECGDMSEVTLPSPEVARNGSKMTEDDGSNTTQIDVKSSEDSISDFFPDEWKERENNGNTKKVEIEEELSTRSEVNKKQNECGDMSQATLPSPEITRNGSKKTEDGVSNTTQIGVKFSKDSTSEIFPDAWDGSTVGEKLNCSVEANISVCDTESLKTKYQEYELKRKALVTDIKYHAEKSLMLLKMSKDSKKQLFGSCEFILGELNSDVSMLRDAKQHFREASSDAGQMECFHMRIKLQDNIHFSNIIDNLTKLYDFIQVLKNYDGANDQRIVNSAENFYDIDLGATPQTSPKFGKDEFKQARVEVVRNHCLPKAALWFKLVKEKLENTEMKTKQCSLFATGRPCTGSNSKCVHFDYRRESILQLVECFASKIRLVHCATQWKTLAFDEAFLDIHSITDEIIKWKYQPCVELYELVFPSHCNRRILTENEAAIGLLLQKIRQSQVKQKMTEWVLNLRKNLDNRDRNCDSNVYLTALNVHRLVKEKPNVIKQWMKEDETQCAKYHSRNPKARRSLGMFVDGNRMVSFMNTLFEYTNALYVLGDPMKAIGSCNMFLGLIANRSETPLIPSIANTVTLIEHAFTVACSVIARAQKCEVFLPASYLAQIQFHEELCRSIPNRRYSFYQAVDFTANIRYNELHGQIRNFVDMMTYSGKYPYFDIIPDAFKSRQYIESGEAERTLVLALVMLCNRNLLNFESAFNLRCHLMPIQTDHLYPPRLVRAVEGIKSAKSLKDLMDVLQELLVQREKEYLLVCHWNSDRSSRYHKLIYKQVNTGYYKDISLGSLQGMHPIDPFVAQDTALHHDTRGDVGENEDAEQKEFEKAVDFENKCKVISNILTKLPARQKILPELMPIVSEKGKLAALVRAQLHEDSVQESQEKNEESKISKHWIVIKMNETSKVDETWCAICRKALDTKADEEHLTMVPSSPIEGAVPNYDILHREISVEETKNTQMEEHTISYEHTVKQKQFDEFKQKITTKLLPSLKDTESLNRHLENCRHADLEVFHGRVKEYERKFITTVNDIIEKHKWEAFEDICRAWNIFDNSVQDLNKGSIRLENESKSTVAAGTINNTNQKLDEVAEQIREENDDEEVHQTLEVVTRKKSGKGGRQKKAKKKKKK
ncbi:TPR and ankyrin repeat-containing protein 1-like [Anneissia japonica]|uniref:TPR and ankyrin repeat-containing protein 1-like n=1 Tax=Anneissia japonica TaxID=1529436 RepID=UPI0014257753|nr:TPR and ankyrin repeat-containing protein 1-like [Anneissia japonica]